MKKRYLAIALLVAFAGAGAFAQLAIGGSGALYGDMDAMKNDTDAVIQNFKNGEGLFYGPFIELGMGKLGLGVSGNFSFYEEDGSFEQDGSEMIEMMTYDISVYLQIHVFKYRSFIDPFLEGGIGMMAKDYQNSDVDPDPENPMAGTKYFEFGGGLGINLGPLGIFAKALYMWPFAPVEGTWEYYDEYHVKQTGTYSLDTFPMENFKVLLGAKVIL